MATLKAVATLEAQVPHVSGLPAAVGKSCSNPVPPMVPVVADGECKHCLAFGGGGSCDGPSTLKYVSGMVTDAMLLCLEFFDEMMPNESGSSLTTYHYFDAEGMRFTKNGQKDMTP